MFESGITVTAAPAPNPAEVKPAAKPRRPANHFSAFPMHVPYTIPAPTPATTAPAYNTVSEWAFASITHAIPERTPPVATMTRGPYLSTSAASNGTSHVSTSTKIVKETWTAARLQPCPLTIGSTNSVQPYCRLAIIAMQITPATSCNQGFRNPEFIAGPLGFRGCGSCKRRSLRAPARKRFLPRKKGRSLQQPGRARPAVLRTERRDHRLGVVRVRRNLVVVEVLARLFDLDIARERGDDRLVDPAGAELLDHFDDEPCEDHRRRHDRVPVAEDQRVDAVVLEPEPDRVLVRLRRLAAGDVDGVAGRPERRDELLERFVQVGIELHEREPGVDDRVREQHARTTGAGDDDDVLALRRRQDRDGARELQHLVQPARANHAALAQHVVVDLVVAGQRTRMRARGTRAELGPAGLELFHVHRDRLRRIVLLEERQQIVLVDVGLVAETDDRGDAHLRGAAEPDDRHPDAARLRGERDAPLDVVRRAERRAQVLRRVVEAVDVRPHQAHVVLAPDLLDLELARFVAGLGEPGRDQHRARDLLLAALDERRGDELRGDREDCDVDLARDLLDRGVRLVAEDLVGFRIDRIDLAFVASVDEVLHHGVADLALFARGADHRDRVGAHDAVHRADDFVLRGPVARLGRIEVDQDSHVDRGRALGHLGGLDAVEHRERIIATRRREPERDVLEHFDEHAAQTERHELAEALVADRADDHFLRARGQHLLHLDAADLRAGLILFRVGDDRVVAAAHRVRALDADQHAAGFGLVENIRRDDLQNDREAHLLRELRGRVGRGREALLRDRQAVRVRDLLRLGRRERAALLGSDPVEDRLYRDFVDALAFEQHLYRSPTGRRRRGALARPCRPSRSHSGSLRCARRAAASW